MNLWIILLSVGILAAAAIFLQWSRKSIVITEQKYFSEKVPGAFDCFRLVQVSDLQSEYFGKNQKNLLQKVRAARPDLIFFTGDLVDRNHTDYGASLRAMEGLCSIAPVCYVNGNHELALPEQNISQMYDTMEKMGVTLLFDRGEFVKRRREQIYIAGLSEETIYAAKIGMQQGSGENLIEKGQGYDSRVSGRGKISDTDIDKSIIYDKLSKVMTGVRDGTLSMLLVHEPQFLETYTMGNVDLIFSGHAHGGQIRLPFTQGLFAPGQGLLPKLTDGMHRRGKCTMVISRGLGNSVFPFRLFNRPEIVVVELRRKKNRI